MSENRDIVVCGNDGDAAKTVFKRMTIPPNLDLEWALKEEIEKLSFKLCTGFKVAPRNRYSYDSGSYQTILYGTDYLFAESKFTYGNEAASFVISEGGGWIYNTKTDDAEYVFIPSWKDRDKVKTKQEAIQYISAHMAKSFSKGTLKEVSEFADKHEIPFSMDLMDSFVSDFNKYQPQWNSSSAYC